ncbi:MAG TPA: hypothetical protein VI456_00835 [Polyangia bacterium]
MIRPPFTVSDVRTAFGRLRAAAARFEPWLAARATTVPFRVVVALALLGLQLAVAIHSADRFDVKRFNSKPGAPPHFRNPATDWAPANWDRLVVSRWDSGNYLELGLRGYQYCPPRSETLPVRAPGCNLAFYPTYGLIGRYVGKLTGLPIDYALFAVSLLSSFLFLYLWTGKELTARLGVGETYLALLCFNAYTTGYCLVTVQTEPLTLVLAMGAYVAFVRRRWLLGALLAGAASGVRITGVAVGMAFAIGMLFELLKDRPRQVWPWIRAALLAALCVWGQVALMAYHAHRFGDPLTYIHAHGQLFHHEHPGLGALFPPDPEKINASIEWPLHEGLWLAAALLWFALGHREALRRFPIPEQAFWYASYFATVGIATVGMMPLGLAGMSRYLLLALPMFFAMAASMRRRPLLALLWIAISAWHYWNIDICTYTGGMGDHTLIVCHEPWWTHH